MLATCTLSLVLQALAPVSPPVQAPISGGLTLEVETTLVPPNPEPGLRFGTALAAWNDLVVIGEEGSPGGVVLAGSAQLFRRTGTWSHVQTLTPSRPTPLGYFGQALAVAEDHLAVGAFGEGRTYVYGRALPGAAGPTWIERAVLGPTTGSSDGDGFGVAVALDGDTLVVGSSGDDTFGAAAGAVYVYSWIEAAEGSGWRLVAKLHAQDAVPGLTLGFTVDVSAGTVIAGAPFLGAGAVYCFEDTGGGWTQTQKLKAVDGTPGDGFGKALSIDGDAILIGAEDDDSQAVGSGSAYVFERGPAASPAWSQVAKLEPSGGASFQRFGNAVDLRGELAVIGATWDSTLGYASGAAYLASRSAGKWITQDPLVPPGTASGDAFGEAVAFAGTTPVATAPSDTVAPNRFPSGSAHVLQVLVDPSLMYCTAGTSASGCTAQISTSGTPSATAPSGFTLSASGVEGAKDGLFFYGVLGPWSAPWGNGTSFQCVLGVGTRLGFLKGSGTPGACDGSFAQDLNALWCGSCPEPGKNPGTGTVVNAQLWYRDPLSTSNQKTSLSNAVQFTVTP